MQENELARHLRELEEEGAKAKCPFDRFPVVSLPPIHSFIILTKKE